MKHLDLFSGIGGFALAAKWLGIETIQFVEIEPYAQKVLKKNFPGVPIHDDIKTFHANEFRGIEFLTGGYPCQPFSIAGKQRGTEDDRHLWPEMLRVIREARPHWIIAENVTGHIRLGLDEVLSDLESEAYSTRCFIIPACAINAPHRRDRVWIIAHANSQSEPDSPKHVRKGERMVGDTQHNGSPSPTLQRSTGEASDNNKEGQIKTGQSKGASQSGDCGSMEASTRATDVANTTRPQLEECEYVGRTSRPHVEPAGSGQDVANANSHSAQGLESGTQSGRHQRPAGLHSGARSVPGPDWWAVEPDVGRVAHGIPRRVDRLRGLGNAIVPQVAYQILKSILSQF